jgi:hypothetical protein
MVFADYGGHRPEQHLLGGSSKTLTSSKAGRMILASTLCSTACRMTPTGRMANWYKANPLWINDLHRQGAGRFRKAQETPADENMFRHCA